MRSEQGHNWIGGQRCPAASGMEFERFALRAPRTARGRWPRSGEDDLDAALQAAQRGRAAWLALGRDARVERILEALGHLERQPGLVDALADALGVDPDVAGERLGGDLMQARVALEILRDAEGEPAGPGLFAAHWSDLVGPLLQRVALRLSAGSPVVLLSDPRLPEAGDALAAALEAADVPPGTLGVLHDDGRTVLRSARRRPALGWGRARGSRAELAALAAGGGTFGAGLTDWSLWPLASAVHVVAEGCDPAAEAAHVVERSLSPSATLFGQLPDAVGRVLCHQRRLSAFTEELLARLDAAPALAEPIAAVEADLPERMAAAWALGLDEGACPVFGEPLADARGRGFPAVRPLVFTNVETGGRLLALERSAPLLRLARAGSDEEAHRLRDALTRRGGPKRLDPHRESNP
jgi:acyl-CoA reductase-like NAD-dependent aldehyde dehydrogenase